MLAFSLPGKPGWLLMLEKAVKVIARVHTLQQVCLCSLGPSSHKQQQGPTQYDGQHVHPSGNCVASLGHSNPSAPVCVQQPPRELANMLSAGAAGMQAAWQSAGDRELQLCLAGLQEYAQVVTGSSISLVQLYRCTQMLEAAASEYASEGALLLGADSVTDAIRRMGLLKLQVEQEEQQVMQKVWQVAINQPPMRCGCSTESGGLAIQPLAQVSGINKTNSNGTASVLSQQALVRCSMHLEALRAFSWCLWLLGVWE